MTKPITYGMIGGGQGAFIGAVHRMAASLDHQARLVAGALSSTPEKSLASGRDLGLPDDRNYPTWQAMLEGEQARPDRIDFVSIVTPNHAHFEPANAFAAAGFHVVLDKPMVLNSGQAATLAATVAKSGVVFAVTYNYTGYPLVKKAADLVRSGTLGVVRKVFVEYHQGWLATPLEATGQKQAGWRTDPKRAGAGAVGDIGSHAENLVATITGLEIESLCADAATFVPGRTIDDDAAVLLRFKGGAKGVLTCSQVCVGEENNLSIRVYGSEGALAWRQENPNELWHTPRDQPRRLITRAGADAGPQAAAATRLPSGHPEGFIEAFANVYRGVIGAIRAKREGRTPDGLATQFPTVHDGARGVRFIERVLESSARGGVWIPA
ncbi:MAG: oxidoreductase [Phycisphaerae bacterium]|nr:MAG: oxidoreductase [Phycisphaerae bacterium]